jgi:rhodanese-related sulfurtransferase
LQITLQCKSDTVIAFCQSGKRSLQAAKILSGIFGDAEEDLQPSRRYCAMEEEQPKQPA